VSTTTSIINIRTGLPYDVYIGRGGPWGNPFSHLASSRAVVQVATRDDAVAIYEKWIAGHVNVSGIVPPTLEQIRYYLGGRVLGCYCKPAACHGDVLCRICNDLDYSCI
jgi:hypothetical protein